LFNFFARHKFEAASKAARSKINERSLNITRFVARKFEEDGAKHDRYRVSETTHSKVTHTVPAIVSAITSSAISIPCAILQRNSAKPLKADETWPSANLHQWPSHWKIRQFESDPNPHNFEMSSETNEPNRLMVLSMKQSSVTVSVCILAKQLLVLLLLLIFLHHPLQSFLMHTNEFHPHLLATNHLSRFALQK
jgi:hypothetical protein